jgi:hypothetical protein
VAKTALIIGDSPAQVHERFATIIEQNFQGNAATIVSRLTVDELANVAAVYNYASGSSPQLLKIIAANVGAEGLTSVAAAFGQEATALAVKQYAPSNVALAFVSSPQKASGTATMMAAVIKGAASIGPIGAMGPAPTPDMTIYEIYLEFRTAPVGNLSVYSAIEETAVYVGARVSLWFGVGYASGNVVNAFLETVFPSFSYAFTKDVASGATALQQAVFNPAATILSIGKVQYAMDSGIINMTGQGEPLSSSGDWGCTQEMSDYSASISC